MNSELQAKVRRQAAAYHVERLQLWFTDHIGELEMVEIPAQRLDELLQSGALPNDSSTSGFGASAGADIIAVPDWSTFRIMPPACQQGTLATVFCNLDSLGFDAPCDIMDW